MGLNDRIHGRDKKTWWIKDEENPFSLKEMEVLIKSKKISENTLVWKKEDTSFNSSSEKKWKEAVKYRELKKIFDDLPPP